MIKKEMAKKKINESAAMTTNMKQDCQIFNISKSLSGRFKFQNGF